MITFAARPVGMHERQRGILELLAHHDGVRFGEMERFFAVRSNALSYHLNRLQEEGLVEKHEERYRLTGEGKTVAPYLGRGQQPLPVVLVAPVTEGEVLLVEREKEVYRGLYAIPSTTLRYGERPGSAVERLQESYGLELDDVRYRKTVVEIDDADDGERQHHFVFLVHRAVPRNQPEGMRFFAIDSLAGREDVIPTDARIVRQLDEPGLDVVGMDISGEPELREDGDSP